MTEADSRDAVPIEVTLEVFANLMKNTPLLILEQVFFVNLSKQFGGDVEADRFLASRATTHGKPIAINLPVGDGGSTTIMVAPEGWTCERVEGWLATNLDELIRHFGAAGPAPSLEALPGLVSIAHRWPGG